MKRFRTTLLMMALGVASNGALASDLAMPALQKTVSFADLDLSRTEGAEALYQRLRSAARQVCAPADGKSLAQKQRYRACVSEAVSNAVVQIDAPLVTDVYYAKNGFKPVSNRSASNL